MNNKALFKALNFITTGKLRTQATTDLILIKTDLGGVLYFETKKTIGRITFANGENQNCALIGKAWKVEFMKMRDELPHGARRLMETEKGKSIEFVWNTWKA